MEPHSGTAYQRFADYCHNRDIDENEAVIAMTVACQLDNLHLITRQGHGAGKLTREPCHILQKAGVLYVGVGNQPSHVDWEKVKHYLSISDKLRES